MMPTIEYWKMSEVAKVERATTSHCWLSGPSWTIVRSMVECYEPKSHMKNIVDLGIKPMGTLPLLGGSQG